jgi:hypothetical protein
VLKNKVLFLGLVAVLVAGFALGSEAIPNWSAPATWTPARSAGVHALSDITEPMPFIGVTPCRIADTRGNGFVGAYGPPSLGAGLQRTFTITGQCGIPTSAAAVSFNFGALNVSGTGDLRIFPAGGGVPLVSTLNYNANTPNIANAAIVPLGAGGAITVQADAVNIDLIIDVNGYYYGGFGFPRLAEGDTFDIYSGFCGGGVNFGENDSACGFSSGIRGRVTNTGTDSAGVEGEATATTGFVHGVYGTTSSGINDNSGVYGHDNSAVTSTQGHNVIGVSGVHGEGKNGVIGSSSTNVSEFGGVTGIMLNSAGGLGAFASLGESFTTAILGEGNSIVTGTKSFVEPHPTDASKMIDYISLEGPEAGTYFRGTGNFSDGNYVIEVPEDFRLVTDSEGLTVQLTPVGAPASMYVVSEDLYHIVVHSDQDVKFHYMVNGVRASFKDYQPIVENTVFNPRSATQKMSGALAPLQRQRLIANGTYNADGSVNLETARAVGWAQAWEERDRQVEASRANSQSKQ